MVTTLLLQCRHIWASKPRGDLAVFTVVLNAGRLISVTVAAVTVKFAPAAANLKPFSLHLLRPQDTAGVKNAVSSQDSIPGPMLERSGGSGRWEIVA